MPRVLLDEYDEDDDDDLERGLRPHKQKVTRVRNGHVKRTVDKYIKKDIVLRDLEPICIECGKLASLVPAEVAYPRKPEYRKEQAYLCECGARVRCHPGTTIAQGFPAKQRIAEARYNAHAEFDALWREGVFTRYLHPRTRAYEWLAQALEIDLDDCHFGMFDLNTCQRATTLCETLARTGALN